VDKKSRSNAASSVETCLFRVQKREHGIEQFSGNQVRQEKKEGARWKECMNKFLDAWLNGLATTGRRESVSSSNKRIRWRKISKGRETRENEKKKKEILIQGRMRTPSLVNGQ